MTATSILGSMATAFASVPARNATKAGLSGAGLSIMSAILGNCRQNRDLLQKAEGLQHSMCISEPLLPHVVMRLLATALVTPQLFSGRVRTRGATAFGPRDIVPVLPHQDS